MQNNYAFIYKYNFYDPLPVSFMKDSINYLLLTGDKIGFMASFAVEVHGKTLQYYASRPELWSFTSYVPLLDCSDNFKSARRLIIFDNIFKVYDLLMSI